MKKILLIEDDMALSRGISLALTTGEITVEAYAHLSKAREKLSQGTYDLIILDVNLPDGNGLDLVKERQEKGDPPILLLTANDMEVDIVTGLEMGASDYITKPFSLAVLRARVNVHLRKGQNTATKRFSYGPLFFDFEKMEYSRKGIPIDLSRTEQKLLRVLVEHAGMTLSRSALVDKIWTCAAEYVDENALSVTVKRLRNKLEEDPSKPEYIKTVYGIGYVWVVD